jgi:hypothetical protein
MVLRSKQESHRTQKPEISICRETGASGERTRLAANFLRPMQYSACVIRPVDWRGRQSQHARAPVHGRAGSALPGKSLAQTPPLSQAPSPMNSTGRSQTRARVLVASVLFAAFSWTLLISVSPRLHECIHSDANRGDHVCAITLIASGSYEHGAQPTVISPPQFDVRFAPSAELTSTWVKPLFLSAHIFAHAPPALV